MSILTKAVRRWTFLWSLVIVLITLLPLYAQFRQVDQGHKGTQAWLITICDPTGTQCGTYAIPTTITNTVTATGTMQANAGTGTFNVTCISGCGGAASFLDTGAFSTGVTPVNIMGAIVSTADTANTIGNGLAGAPRMGTNRILFIDLSKSAANSTNFNVTATGTVSATSGTVNSATISSMPTVNVGTLTTVNVGTMPQLTFTSGTVNSITMPSLTFTSGTVTSMPAVTGTVQANAGTGTFTVTGSITNSQTIGQMPTLSVTSGTIGQMPTLSVTSGTVGNTVTISPTGTQSINLAQVLGAALTTANPVIGGARGSTTVPTAVADAAVVAKRLDKFGDTIIQFAPIDLVVTGTIKPTTTAATQILAAAGANTKYLISAIVACNLSGTVATEMDVTDSAGTIAMIPWTATALNGEPRCFEYKWPDGWPTAVNSTISGKLTTADATGVFVSVRAYKTGT